MLFLILVAAFNIISSLIMIVLDKRREVGILLALGAHRWMIRLIFLAEGFIIGLAGSLSGCLIGWLVTALENHYHFITLPGNVYNLDYLSMKPVFSEFLGVGVITVIISLLATALPAWSAPRLNILSVIKDK